MASTTVTSAPSTKMTNTHSTIATDADLSANEHIEWRAKTQRLYDKIGFLKREYDARKQELSNSKKPRAWAELRVKKKDLAKASKSLRLARTAFTDHIEAQAINTCRPLCETVNEKLPQELRDMIVQFLLPGGTVSFHLGNTNRLEVTDGFKDSLYCFNPEYTGSGLHNDIMNKLAKTGARFHFSDIVCTLGNFFNQYTSGEYNGLALFSHIQKLSVAIYEYHLHYDKRLLDCLEKLFQLAEGASIHLLFEINNNEEDGGVDQAYRLFDVLFPILKRLSDAGYAVMVVVKPEYDYLEHDGDRKGGFPCPKLDEPKCQMTALDPEFHPDGFAEFVFAFLEENGGIWPR